MQRTQKEEKKYKQKEEEEAKVELEVEEEGKRGIRMQRQGTQKGGKKKRRE